MLCFNRTNICNTDENKQVGKLSFTPVGKNYVPFWLKTFMACDKYND